MSEKRFTHKNGKIIDNKSKGDTNHFYNLNIDEGRLDLMDFMNAREDMIDDLNDDISRLSKLIDEQDKVSRKLRERLRKRERICDRYKEITHIFMEMIDEIER